MSAVAVEATSNVEDKGEPSCQLLQEELKVVFHQMEGNKSVVGHNPVSFCQDAGFFATDQRPCFHFLH